MKASIDKKKVWLSISGACFFVIILPFKSKILCTLQVCGPNSGKNQV